MPKLLATLKSLGILVSVERKIGKIETVAGSLKSGVAHLSAVEGLKSLNHAEGLDGRDHVPKGILFTRFAPRT